MIIRYTSSGIVLAAVALLSSACTKKVAQTTPSAPVPVATPAEPAKPKPAQNTTQAKQNAPAKEAPRQAGITPQERQQLNESLGRMADALFDYDKSTIRPDAAQSLSGDVGVVRNILNRYPQEVIHLEGHADQRGSDEYNLALGDRRAEAVREFLVNMGIRGNQMTTVSYGKNRPVCSDTSEDCYQRNRRVHLASDRTN